MNVIEIIKEGIYAFTNSWIGCSIQLLFIVIKSIFTPPLLYITFPSIIASLIVGRKRV